MTHFEMIVLGIGIVLLALGLICGISISYRAIKQSDKASGEGYMVSLWSMFVLGIAFGLLLIWLALP